MVAFFGIQKLGAVVVPVSPIYTSLEVSYMIKDSGAQTIICHDTNFGYVKETFQRPTLKKAIVTNLVDLLPLPKRGLRIFSIRSPTARSKRQPIFSFKELLKSPPTPPRSTSIHGRTFAYILYTGGTTGFPKGSQETTSGMTSYVRDVIEDVAGGIPPGGEGHLYRD